MAKYNAIEINFINAGTIIIDKNWDDYDYVDGFIIIKNHGAWVAMYNAKEVFSVVLREGE